MSVRAPKPQIEIKIVGYTINPFSFGIKRRDQTIQFTKNRFKNDIDIEMSLIDGDLDLPEFKINIDRKSLVDVLEFLIRDLE